ncbi:HLA class II histocompatibility antigen, DP beta 1 chain-like [Suncus etruscus]|uniref:HLA class II histocompatibility antigen, DP beta 1 chain-like n=1 Tax=Suncus etruscus TaxID=109475 RepID=UPI00211097D9|nr:HLA class II histocompatibility antigen, DP beta 1 chain-like [Suncus etruscus]
MSLKVPKVPGLVVLMVLLMLLSNPVTQGKTTPENYLLQRLFECYESNGKQRLVDRYIYNREEFLNFDSDLGQYVAVTELGQPEAEEWNRIPQILQQAREEVNRVCKHNYGLDQKLVLKHLAKPKVSIYPSRAWPLLHPKMLVCHITDFYPRNIEVRWFLNGKEESSKIVSTTLIRNGDWTFQNLVILKIRPQQGDIYTCQVDHLSLDSTISAEWTFSPHKPPETSSKLGSLWSRSY